MDLAAGLDLVDLAGTVNHSCDNRNMFCSSVPSSNLLRTCQTFSVRRKSICYRVRCLGNLVLEEMAVMVGADLAHHTGHLGS